MELLEEKIYIEKIEKLTKEITILRELLWLNHGHTCGLYGDDGEMQCSECELDFKRHSVEIIKKRFGDIQQEKIMEFVKSGGFKKT